MTEPVRKSYLDLIKTNLAAAERNQFITRLVYVGTYNETHECLLKKYEIIVNYLRSEYSDVPITGFLLVYPRYFLHVLETSDEIIIRHFNAIFYDQEMKIDIGRVLPLPPYHHVHKCFFPRWMKVFTTPPTLLDKLEATSIEEVEKQLTNCLTKVYSLCEYLAKTSLNKFKAMDEALNLGDEVNQYLPESTLLEFLLTVDSPILKDIREYVDLASATPFIRLYNDFIWPPICDFMPRDVFVEKTSRRELMLQRLSQWQQSQRQTK